MDNVLELVRAAGIPGGSGVFIDFTNLQWWQSLVGLIGILGLSPAPWILGLATGKIQFAAQANANYEARVTDLQKNHDARIEDIKAHHVEVMAAEERQLADVKESRDGYKTATQTERERADRATDALGNMVEAVQAGNHIVRSLTEALPPAPGGAA